MKKTKATSKPKSTKNLKEAEKLKKENLEKQQKEQNFKRLEDYLNESGLSLAFNIIFAELISKQILPENFFTYTSMRLSQIGKEIEGLKTKEVILIDKGNEGEEHKEEELKNDKELDPIGQQNENDKELLFMTRPEQKKETQHKQENQKKEETHKQTQQKNQTQQKQPNKETQQKQNQKAQQTQDNKSTKTQKKKK